MTQANAPAFPRSTLVVTAHAGDFVWRAGGATADPRADTAGRRIVRQYYAYLDRHGALVTRLCASGVPAWVVRGDHDEIGLTEDERRGLEVCPHVRTVTVPDAGHAVLVEQPARVADVVVEAVAAR